MQASFPTLERAPEPEHKPRTITWHCGRCRKGCTNHHKQRAYAMNDIELVVCADCYRWLTRRLNKYTKAGWNG